MKVKASSSSSVSAKIIRKDGTVEDLGVISYRSSNPIKNLLFRLGFRKMFQQAKPKE